jgi:hypothetical protein
LRADLLPTVAETIVNERVVAVVGHVAIGASILAWKGGEKNLRTRLRRMRSTEVDLHVVGSKH